MEATIVGWQELGEAPEKLGMVVCLGAKAGET